MEMGNVGKGRRQKEEGRRENGEGYREKWGEIIRKETGIHELKHGGKDKRNKKSGTGKVTG